MKKWKAYLVFPIGSAGIVFAVLLAACLVRRWPAIAVAIGFGLIAGIAAHSLTLQFAPRYVAEKRLGRFMRKGVQACAAHFDAGEDSPADLLFQTTLEQCEGLKKLVFSSGPGPWGLDIGDSLDINFSDGFRGVYLTGTLEAVQEAGPGICQFTVAVQTIKLSGRTRAFTV